MTELLVRGDTAAATTAVEDGRAALLIAMARSGGVTATRAAQALYGVEIPNAEQRQAALAKLRSLAASGRLTRDNKPARRVVNLDDPDTDSGHYKGFDRTGDRAVANADRSKHRTGPGSQSRTPRDANGRTSNTELGATLGAALVHAAGGTR